MLAKVLAVMIKALVDSLLVVMKVEVVKVVVAEVVKEDKVEEEDKVEAKVMEAEVKVVGAEDQVVEGAAVVWEVQEVAAVVWEVQEVAVLEVLEEVRWAAVVEDKWVVQEVLRAKEAKAWAKMVIHLSNNNNRWLASSPTNHLKSSALVKFQSKEAS